MMSDPPPPGSAGVGDRAWAWTLGAMVLAGLDLSLHLFQHWVAFDDGSMGLAAALVRDGAWPHRDFSDTYSGGLALLDAAAQWLFGDDLRALRIPFGVAAILWVGVLADCFRRFVSAPAAAGLALLAFLWGPPLYTGAMPSWYLLFLATAVIWCLLRWHETGRASWWGAVGGLIGLALFIKVNALFILAGAGCVLVTHERVRGGPLGALLIAGGIGGACLTVAAGWPLDRAAALMLPLLALLAATAWPTIRGEGGMVASLRRMVVPIGWLCAGLAAVLIPWIGAYAIAGALPALIEGVAVLPFRRPEWARHLPPGWWWPDLLAGALLLVLVFRRWGTVGARWTAIAVVAGALFVSEWARLDPEWMVVLVWRELRVWALLALVGGAALALRRDPADRRPTLVVAWVAGWFALIQYPFGAPNYLAYVAPLVILAATAAVADRIARPVGAALAAALGIWTLGVDHGQPLSLLGFDHRSPVARMVPLALPRGGIQVPEDQARGYEAIVATLDRWEAGTIVAGPDAPEVYYLSGRPFVGRDFFEFLGADWSADSYAAKILGARPDAVVLNTRPYFSRVRIDSVLARLPKPVAETTIGRYQLLRMPPVQP